MSGRITAIVFVLVIASLLTASAQDNPFISTGPKAKKDTPAVDYPTFMSRSLSKLRTLQRNLYEKLAELVEAVRESRNPSVTLFLILISFLYGAVHAIGPGHGKSIAASFFLSRDVPLRTGLLMGGLIALLHAGSAIVVVLTVYLILQQAYLSSLENVSRIVRIASYSLISVIGLLMFIAAILEGRTDRFEIPHSGMIRDSKQRSLFSIALAIGIVPCPGAILILLFCLSMELLAAGVFLVLVMALGMGLTISAVGSTAILARRGISQFLLAKSNARRILLTGLRLFGSFLIFFMGALLLLGTLS